MRSIGRLRAVMALTLAVPAVAGAANKEHQQLMAEIRMLQEQQQQLQQLLGGLADTLKVDDDEDRQRGRRDAQGVRRSEAAGQRHRRSVRVLREKADDTNVRLSTMTQELEALRQTMASMPSPSARRPRPRTDPAAGDPAAPARLRPADRAWPRRIEHLADTHVRSVRTPTTAAGQFDLAVDGFQAFIRTFPTSPKADDAQLNIGYSLYNAGKNTEAVAALQKVISDYPQSDSVSSAYYKLGLTYEGSSSWTTRGRRSRPSSRSIRTPPMPSSRSRRSNA